MERIELIKAWVVAAFVRAIRTAAQAAVGAIGSTTCLGGVDWLLVASTSAVAAVVSVLTSLAGIPEVGGGKSIAQLAKGTETE